MVVLKETLLNIILKIKKFWGKMQKNKYRNLSEEEKETKGKYEKNS